MSARRTVVTACAAVLGLLSVSGPASATPVAFPNGAKLEAECTEGDLAHKDIKTLLPLPGPGAFTPYRVVETGQLLVPSEFRLHVGPALKTRHVAASGTMVVKPGPTGPVSCEVTGSALDADGNLVELKATIIGALVG